MRPSWKTAPVYAQGLNLVEGFFPGVSSMEVWRRMITMINVDNNSKEAADTRHSLLTLLNKFPDGLWPGRHVEMLHSVRRQRIDDRIDDRRRGADGSGFAHAFDTQRVDRRRRFGPVEFEPGKLRSLWYCIVHQLAGYQLALFVVHDFFVQRLTDRLHDAAMKL